LAQNVERHNWISFGLAVIAVVGMAIARYVA
jgi:hypothetical protein